MGAKKRERKEAKTKKTKGQCINVEEGKEREKKKCMRDEEVKE